LGRGATVRGTDQRYNYGYKQGAPGSRGAPVTLVARHWARFYGAADWFQSAYSAKFDIPAVASLVIDGRGVWLYAWGNKLT